MSDSMKEVVETLDPVSRRLIPQSIDSGTLVPLKTTLELRDNLSVGLAYVTRAPTKLTNDVVNIVRAMVGDEAAKNLPHLRRCSKPNDLPPHLKNQFMNEGQSGRAIHVGKSQWLYILLGPKDDMDYQQIVQGLSAIDGIRDDIFVGLIPVPLLAPTSQVQANMWSQQFWQTVYRKNNPLGPHPSNICRTTGVVSRDANIWMSLAHQVAKKAHKAGLGEPIGAVIIKRTIPSTKPETVKAIPTTKADDDKTYTDKADANCLQDELSDNGATKPEGKVDTAIASAAAKSDAKTLTASADAAKSDGKTDATSNATKSDGNTEATNSEVVKPDEPEEEQKETVEVVALAGDARWYRQEKIGRTGNPMAHAALRAISMVAQKLVRAEKREPAASKPILEFEAFQDKPLLSDEQLVFETEHPSPDGYLCHELELYMTHEPCTMCAMAILHSRMGRIVFRHRMPLTGGMGSEDRGHDICGAHEPCPQGPCGGGQGLGLHWRKELNWSMLGWEWETDETERLTVDPHLHA